MARFYPQVTTAERRVSRSMLNMMARGLRRVENDGLDRRFFAFTDSFAGRRAQFNPNALADALLPRTFHARLDGWNSDTSSYDWTEQQRNTADTAFVDLADGRNSTDHGEAKHVNGAPDLPDDLLVTMHTHTDADGDTRFFFDVPVHYVSGIVHRTTLAGSGTYGVREDLTKTEAELKQKSQLDTSADVFVGSQAAGKLGWIRTLPSRGFIWDDSGGTKKYFSGYKDFEFDPLGRGPLSESEEFYVEIIDLEAC